MGAVTPFHLPGEMVTAYCEGDVVGGTFVAISGPRTGGLPTVGTAGGGTSGLTPNTVGIALFDALTGSTVTVQHDGVAEVLAGANISAGARIKFDSAGKAVTADGAVFHGIAWDDITSGQTGPIDLQLNRAIDS